MSGLVPSLRTTSHFLLASCSTLLLVTIIRTQPTQADTDELRTSLIAFGGCALLTVWTVRLGDMLRGGARAELDRGRSAVVFEAGAGVAGWCWSAVLFPRLLSLPSTPTRTRPVLLLSAIVVLTFGALFGLAINTRTEGFVSLASTDEEFRLSSASPADEKVPAAISRLEEGDEELLTDSPLFLGILLGGSLTCLISALSLSYFLGISAPSTLFLPPCILSVPLLLTPHRLPRSIATTLTATTIVLAYYAAITFSLSPHGAPTCGIFDPEAFSTATLELAPILCQLAKVLYYASWLTLAGLVVRLFGIQFAARLEDDRVADLEAESEAEAVEAAVEPWGWRDEVEEAREKVVALVVKVIGPEGTTIEL